MRRTSLWEGIFVAGALALAGLGAWSVLPHVFGVSFAFRGMIAGLSMLYLLVLLSRTSSKVGRMACGMIGSGVLLAALIAGVSWAALICLAVAVIWITRSLFSYTSLVGVVADALVCLVSVGWAFAAYSCTGSLVWALWCFFLAQALASWIPEVPVLSTPGSEENLDRFARAHRAAEAVVRELANR